MAGAQITGLREHNDGPMTGPTAPRGRLAGAVEFARRQPGRLLAYILTLHVVIWTLLPILVCPNLQLDLVEDLALGKEWQLGYWKHPPLPWWLADIAYRITGDIHAIYLLGPLSAAACMYFVWRLAREVVPPLPALASVLALEGIHFFNFSVVKFAHDQMQLPFWALTGWVFYRAVTTGRILDWALSGAFLALAFWSKYAAFALSATLGLFLLFDPQARQCWRTVGPYIMALVFLLVLAPHLWWLIDSGFAPFRYVDSRAIAATHWYDFVWFPLRWTLSQIFFLVPALILLALLLRGAATRRAGLREDFTYRYVLALAFGPFAVTTLAAALFGRLPVAMWGYPLWSFLPLAIVMTFDTAIPAKRLGHFARAFLGIFVATPVLYAGIELFEPFLRDRVKATQFPGRPMAEAITQQWRSRTGATLVYVSGRETTPPGTGEFAANNLAVYSPDRPHVVVHGKLALSPWIDPADLARRGAVLVWEMDTEAAALPADLRAAFPTAEMQPPLVLRRQNLRPRSPAIVGYAFVLPRDQK